MPVRIPDPGTVALLRVGDRVDLLVTETDASAASTLATDVPVLALPRSPATAAGPVTTSGALVVLGTESAWPGRCPRRPCGLLVVGDRRSASGHHASLGAPSCGRGRRRVHMQGFKDFILKGNLIELAVAFIMATAFAAVVTTFTGVLMGFIGKAGGQPDFSRRRHRRGQTSASSSTR